MRVHHDILQSVCYQPESFLICISSTAHGNNPDTFVFQGLGGVCKAFWNFPKRVFSLHTIAENNGNVRAADGDFFVRIYGTPKNINTEENTQVR